MAECFTVASVDAGSPSFSLNSGPYRNVPVYVHQAKGLPADAWEQVYTNPLFGEWASNLCHEGRLKVERITIQQLKPEICFNVEATNSQGTAVNGPVYLRPMQSAILIVLRNSVTNLELCVFCKRPDLATGLNASLALVEGTFDQQGKLEGPCGALLEKHLNLSLHRDDCVDLLTAAHGRIVGDSGVTCCPSSATADAPPAIRSRLLLYRSVATPDVLQKLEHDVGRTKKHGYPPATIGTEEGDGLLGLSVVYMGDTWRAMLDPRAVFALFLLVEFRYHQLKLPKPPRDAAHDGKTLARRGDAGNATLGVPPKKAVAQFRKISSLSPLCTGVNLRVKVVEPIKPAPDIILPRGQTIKRATMVVGDDEAMITLNLEGAQLELPDVVNTPLLIRNAKVEMEDGHMRLAVDKWGKISDARDDDFKDFNFSVCTTRNMSEQEYELVHMSGGDDANEGNGGRSGGGPPFGGRGRNMRGRGRGGFRGGRGRRGM
ncbi:uncharacterized protein EMH_0034910 [Eimeria mitis]|uniref:Single-stranded DNA binding protein Ssb-like OB fold domain-containing protein n=1 Tax=Eimeria mitis TaxID=44415 RepID=U6K2D5_9EIME|nr:uncharacterized protein EMH_0034910 [Eimeria mitis]CDJ31161.1 hypothetical protein, conserved [Eimeria mitis]